MADITGLHRGQLLELLVMGPTFLAFMPSFETSARSEEAASWRVYQGFIDYYQGKTIMADLRYDFIDPQWYDAEAGIGAFQQVVDYMRQQQETADADAADAEADAAAAAYFEQEIAVE